MTNGLGQALTERVGRPVTLRPCRITQVTPLLVSFDGGVSSTPGVKIAGATYSTSTTDNALALLQSPATPVVLPIG